MSTTRHTDSVEVIVKDQRRRRWSPSEKAALVLGISVDSAWCHQAFRDARKLHFDLLSDYEPNPDISP